MAVSLLEQRLEALAQRVPLSYPPRGLPPSLDTLEEEYDEDGLALAGRRLRRSHTWAGYAGRLLRLDFQGLERGEPAAACPSLPEGFAQKAGPELGEGKEGPEMARVASEQSTCCDDGSTFCSSSPSSRRSSWSSAAGSSDAGAGADPAAAAAGLGCGFNVPVGGTDEGGNTRAARRQRGKRANAAAGRQQRQSALTTLMVQNLSRSTTRHRFLEALHSLGFEGRYDFVHVPTSFQTGRNQGFAFVNFVSEEDAQRFAGQFQAADGTRPADKLWRVAPADVQGFEANSAASQTGKLARVRSSAHRPVVFPESRRSA